MPITFDDLRIRLGGGPVLTSEDRFGSYCEILRLSAEELGSIDGLTMWDTGFPGCFRFIVPVVEGEAIYTGVVEIGSKPLRHLKGTLELWPPLGQSHSAKCA